MNTEAPNPEVAQNTKRILVADDDESICRLLSILLNKYGDVTCVDCGNSAIELLQKQTFDLILADYEMAQGSGLDVLKHINDAHIKTPAIMITAFGSKDLFIKSIEQHIFGFIEKPFTQEIVDNLVKKALTIGEEQRNMENLARFGTTVGEIVHEISSPLTVLDIQIREMADDPITVDVKKMIKSVEKIKNIIVSTKDSIRGSQQDSFQVLEFIECLNEAAQEFTHKAKEKNVTVKIEGEFGIPVLADKNKICQVVVNLVNNAIDAASTHEEKWVRIQTQNTETRFNLLITDSGKGIPENIKQKLFQTLFTTKGNQGNGLGLSIVKKIAKEHQGDVFLNESCLNTQFIFTLPIFPKQ